MDLQIENLQKDITDLMKSAREIEKSDIPECLKNIKIRNRTTPFYRVLWLTVWISSNFLQKRAFFGYKNRCFYKNSW